MRRALHVTVGADGHHRDTLFHGILYKDASTHGGHQSRDSSPALLSTKIVNADVSRFWKYGKMSQSSKERLKAVWKNRVFSLFFAERMSFDGRHAARLAKYKFQRYLRVIDRESECDDYICANATITRHGIPFKDSLCDSHQANIALVAMPLPWKLSRRSEEKIFQGTLRMKNTFAMRDAPIIPRFTYNRIKL
jgi:hypothetical protein